MALTAVILTKNNQTTIRSCLKSLDFTDKLILVDSGSTDQTINIAKQFKAELIHIAEKDFSYSKARNLGLQATKTEWIFYIDSDEVVSPALKKTIQTIIKSNPQSQPSAFKIHRQNYIMGHLMKHGGWQKDYLQRLFQTKKLKKWIGPVHEKSIFTGQEGVIKQPIIHYTSPTMNSILAKGRSWCPAEAQLLFKVDHPPVTWWRLVKVTLFRFLKYHLKDLGFLDGYHGWIQSFIQSYHTFLTYAHLWHLQNPCSKNDK